MVGERIRKLRKARDWTQKELGERSQVDAKNISNYESGRLQPSRRTIKRFAEAFGIAVEELESETPQDPTLAIEDPEILQLCREMSRLSEADRNHVKWVINIALRQSRIQEMMAS